MKENMLGPYIVFEGPDCAGKTTLLKNVNNIVRSRYPSIVTKHPGATPLGQHLRKLVKTPEEIDKNIIIDPMSVQLFMMVDQISFVETILKKELTNGKIVFADRCNLISAIVYGLTEGLNIADLNNMYNLVKSPRPDKVFILSLPVEEVERRRKIRHTGADRFEDQGIEFLKSICEAYDNLLTINQEISILLNGFVPLGNITHIDATKPEELLAEEVAAEVIKIAEIRDDYYEHR